jgi:hypothetical protein
VKRVNILMNNPRVDEPWCRKILSHYLRPRMKVLVVPFSFHEDYIPDEAAWHRHYDPGQTGYEEIVRPLEHLGIPRSHVAFVNFFTDTPRTMGEMLYQADVVDLVGGYPDRLMDRLWAFGAVSQLSAFPGVCMGFSAGAMAQLDYFHATPEEEGQQFYYYEGLERITDFDIEVHYTGSEIQQACISRTLSETGRKVIALEEQGGLILEGDRLIRMGRTHIFEA